MNAEQKKQYRLLAVLLVVAVGVGVYEYQTNFATPSGGGSVAGEQKVKQVASAIPAASNATIRQDLIAGRSDQRMVGRRNVFQYYVPPPPPKPEPPPPPVLPPVRPQPQPPIVTQVQPQPPFSALSQFKFDGIGIVAKPGKLVASIFDNSNHYYVSEGDYILGRYRVVQVTETSVVIEDMDQNRRQTYTRITTI